jgi:polyvinyl alcohol dehydrogenase (cytochrome)
LQVAGKQAEGASLTFGAVYWLQYQRLVSKAADRFMTKLGCYLSVALLLVAAGQACAEDTAPSGEALFAERCASCHEAGVARAPAFAALRQMSGEQIFFALTYGRMSQQGRDLARAEIVAIIRYLAGAAPAPQPILADASCRSAARLDDTPGQPQWNGWGVGITQHRFQPAAMAQLAAADVPRLKPKWAFGFPADNRAYAQPTVWGGRLFVGSARGKVYALDAATGCQHWAFDAGFAVRTAITVARDARGMTAYFADQRGNAFAVDAESGHLIWKTRVHEHAAAQVTGAPTLHAGVLYVPVSSVEEVLAADPRYACCSFRGAVVAVDAASGQVLWRGYTIAQAAQPVRLSPKGVQLFGPSGAGVWSSPTVDEKARTVYATTGDSYSDPAAAESDAFVAFRMDTGELAWSRQMTANDAYNIGCVVSDQTNCPQGKGPDFDFGSSPVLVTLPGGGRALIAGQKSGMVHAIDPDRQGAIIWQRRVGRGGALGGVQWGSAVDDENVYVAVSDVVPRLVAPGTAGARKPAFGPGSFQMDPNVGGGLYALKLSTGEVRWHTPHPGCGGTPGCSPAQSAAVTAIPGIVFSGGLDGHLRAYAAETGEIVWDVDTARDYTTVNGVAAHGGSLDGPGAVVAGGMLYVNSGYTNFGTAPGNVLLAFSVDGK